MKQKNHTYSPYRMVWIVIFLCLIFFGLGLRDIGKQTLVDEPLWLFKRVENYAKGIHDIDLLKTRVSNKPGVTISILSSPSLAIFRAPSILKDNITPEQHEHLATLMRIPILICVTFLLVFLYYVIRHLTDQITALFTLTFIALSPTLLGMTRIVNPDALLWILLPLTFWSMIIALKQGSRRSVVIAGLLFGFGLLTKYITNILFIMMPLISACLIIYDNHLSTRVLIQSKLKKHLRTILIITMIASVVYIVFLPSTWVRPIHLLYGTFLSEAFISVWEIYVGLMIFFAIDVFFSRVSLFASLLKAMRRIRLFLTSTLVMTFFFVCVGVIITALLGIGPDYQEAIRSPKSAGKSLGFMATFLSGFYSIVFGLSLWVLMPFLVTLLLVPTFKKENQFLIVISLLFVVLYYAGSAVSGVAPTLRYQIALFPLILFVAAYGARHICCVRPLDRFLIPIYGGVSVVILSATMLMQAPHYMSYHNTLLPPGHLFDYKNMGDGSYQAAAYLNDLPYASDMTIWADKAGVCAAFIGRCTTTMNASRIARENLQFEYFVISPGREHKIVRSTYRRLRQEGAPKDNVYYFSELYETTTPKFHTIMRTQEARSALHIISARDVNIQRENEYKVK